ncbi:MAG TPA: TetR family transcriptional regulator C-terminal domain-containing protein [Candidatus Dormibacteraeota bacterium]|nr:TetR family transcriptional regulator C-terminal domain-containing protein [Candidatus Dormibacteraeota bacterium]
MPKIVQHDERRAAIARAAWRTIARDGVDASTVRAIARDAGCSTGVLQHYFPDKDALLLHALRLATARTGGRMARRAQAAGGATALREVLREALPLDADSRLEWRIWLAFWGRAVNDANLAAEQRRRYVEWRGLLRGLLRDAQRRGDLPRRLDPGREAEALVAFVDGIGLSATLEPARLPPARQRALVDAYVARLR